MMKRRTFLSMFSAAAVAPALPAMAVAPSKATMSLAAAHARKYPLVSVIGLSKKVGVSQLEARSLLVSLSRKGLVGPLQHAGAHPVFAGSKVFVPNDASLLRMAQAQRAKRTARLRKSSHAQQAKVLFDVEMDAFWAHLRSLCRRHGLTVTSDRLSQVAT